MSNLSKPSLSKKFLDFSSEIGKNPLIIQGPGGNTSCKEGNVMWIKASGKKLSDANEKDIFVAVDKSKVLKEIADEGDGSCKNTLIDSECSLRPSIETTFHALLPQKYIFHTHSVNCIANSISIEGKKDLAKKLEGLRWGLVDYYKPGLALTHAISKKIKDGFLEVIVLANHGLIVAADSIDDIKKLMISVEERLALPSLLAESIPLEIPIDVPPGWTFVTQYNGLVADKLMKERVSAGSYYPDHVVFLGPSLPCIHKDEVARYCASSPRFPVVLVGGVGVLQKTNASETQKAMLGCIYNVLCRVPNSYQLCFLSADNEAELLNWDAEEYRQKLAKSKV